MHWTVPSTQAADFVAAPEWMVVAWFVLLGFILAMYAVLDGFDLGVGIVHFASARGDAERAAQIGAIGPVWDGNEVRLVVFGGALFAAFPVAYATIFSAFYLPLIALLFCLILRAASIELRHVFHAARWQYLCDVGFCVSSFLAAVIFGVAVGASMQGLPLGPAGEFAPHGAGTGPPGAWGSVAVLISPFSIATGLLSAALCAVHGAAYLGMKTRGQHGDRCRRVTLIAWCAFFLMVLVVTAFALTIVPAATRNLTRAPWLWIVAAAGAASTLWAMRAIVQRRPVATFIGTCLMSATLVGLFMAALFPDLVIDAEDPARSLGMMEAASSRFTLLLMFFVVLVAAPLVAAYTLITYGTFGGRPTTPAADSGVYS